MKENDTQKSRTTQVFTCAVCGEEYQVVSNSQIDRTTIECGNCGASEWHFPMEAAE